MSNSNMVMGQAAAAGTLPLGAWDLSYAYYDDPFAWNVSTEIYSGKSFSVAAQETSPTGLFFKPDGLKMYVIGDAGNDVNEYNLSTAWEVNTASFLQNFSVAAQETSPNGLFFKPDGLKMYITGASGDAVYEYDLSTAWDISTATLLQSFSVASQEAQPQEVFFKPDGLKMYILGRVGDDVNEYDLSTAWDISTASFLQRFSVAAQETNANAMFFKPDGTKMYITGDSADVLREYDLSTAWDVSTASYLRGEGLSGQDGVPMGLFFKPDGSLFYMVGFLNDTVYQYTLGGFSVAAQETRPTGIAFKPDGTKMYVVGSSGDEVNEYTLSTSWDTSTASATALFSVGGQDTVPTGVFFKTDGTKMYVLGATGQDINEYDLSTAWDVSSASYLQNFSVAAQETLPADIFFKPDGTKMYVAGINGQDINEYDLSTAWDVSSASYLQNFSVSAQETAPEGLFFKPDGKKMYVVGSAGDDVNEYTLSTSWDISTASYVQNFSVAAQDPVPRGVYIKDDGTQMFVLGGNTPTPTGKVFTYTLGPQ